MSKPGGVLLLLTLPSPRCTHPLPLVKPNGPRKSEGQKDRRLKVIQTTPLRRLA